MRITIRTEQAEDCQGIHDVTVAAFLNAPHTDHTEQHIVKALRDSGMLSVSLVADEDGVIIGHVALSPVDISDHAAGWYGLGPISVAPEHQGRGIGSALMKAAIHALTVQKAAGCVVLGDPDYYRRFGFEPQVGLELDGVPPEYFMARLFTGDWPTGTVTYHESFSATGD